MSEPPKSCPFCGGAQLTKMMGGPDAWHCDGCGADSPCWSRRAYGPATAAIEVCRHLVAWADSWFQRPPILETVKRARAVLAEHEPANSANDA